MRTRLQGLAIGAAALAVALAFAALPNAQVAGDPVVGRIIELGTKDNRALVWNDYASNRFGGRETGSNSYTDAAQWAVWQLKQFGLEARLEKVGELPVGFNRGPWFGKMLKPAEKALRFGTPSFTAGTKGIQRGHVVVLKADPFSIPGRAQGGRPVAPENVEKKRAAVQEALVKANHGVPTGFPDEALREARRLPSAPLDADFRGREDLRALPFVTIDGATARDFDDAIYVEKNRKGYALWVAIADVAHYVPIGSGLDREAFDRGNSYYFPASVEPMFPQALSNGLCSLNPRVPRLAVAVRMDMSAQGTPGEVRVMNAVIQSHARLTYDRARDVCVDKAPAARAELAAEAGDPVVAMLDLAEALARQMRQRRLERGSLDFDLPEGEVRFGPDGQPVAVEPRERHFAHQLIEEFMIAANEAVSEFLQAHALPCLYRVHAEPDREKLETLYTLLSRLDGEAAPKRAKAGRFSDDDFTPEAIGRLLSSVAGTEREFLVNRLVLRSMKQARYQPDNEGHFGLASESYAHFTSPIRRYADLIVHRLVKRALGDQAQPVPGFKKLAEMGQHLSARERVSQEAERECHKRYACLVLRDRVGEEFAGVVSSLMDYGFWVELPDVMAEGFIRLSTMLDDYYGYFKEREMLLGQRTGKVIRAGQAVRAKLIGVHLDRLEIDLELAGGDKTSAKGDGKDTGLSPLPRADRPRTGTQDRRESSGRQRADQGRSKRRGSSGQRPGKASGKASGKTGRRK